MAKNQAAIAGHPLSDELQLLAVHGTLHLLGYDHATPEEEKQMWSVQEMILSSLSGGMSENTFK
jgi:probable rRNA maturation factor